MSYLFPYPFPFVISDYTPETSQDTPFFSPDVRRNAGDILLSISHHHQIVLFLTLDITNIRFSVLVTQTSKNHHLISSPIVTFSKNDTDLSFFTPLLSRFVLSQPI